MIYLESAYDFLVWWVLLPYVGICLAMVLWTTYLEKRK